MCCSLCLSCIDVLGLKRVFSMFGITIWGPNSPQLFPNFIPISFYISLLGDFLLGQICSNKHNVVHVKVRELLENLFQLQIKQKN